ncbi:hypothetical protein LSH36_79g05027 [Paralvinella palmiformis]|uniref:HAT C-terminal dimerisation domain-containing protein n=1 Tax=Paralvinella palmiformis TaxID=53620 RepID=A0AAD9NCE8_9ANNE|nr:hypothetical protein LSH36_79g05027 [Paralvinella palmiformis]
MSDDDNNVPTITTTVTLSEINDHLSQPCTDPSSDRLLYWNSQQRNPHILANTAADYLSVPTSSAPVERLFSVTGRVFHPDRCLLADLTFDRLMFIRCNNS